MKFNRLRGFKDISGNEAAEFTRLELLAARVFGSFGFKEIMIPVLEEKSLFTHALGTETDVVQKEMYEFTDRSKTQVALRPEGTAGVVRAYLENNFDKNEGHCKFYYNGPMFRNERPQAGRLRQFHQIGVEQLGTESAYADAETIHCLCAFLDAAGIRGYEVKLNNLGTFDERKDYKEKLKSYLKPKKNDLCQDCQRRYEKNVFRILDCKIESCRKIIEHTPPIHDFLTPQSQEHFNIVLQALSSVGVSYKISPYMVRGLDYYTKTVFEISHPGLGAQDALAAGGRYDHLIETFGGPKAGAVGFALGVERLLLCLPEAKKTSVCKNLIFLAVLGEPAMKLGFKILSDLRVAGLHADMDFSAKSLKSQMRSANKQNARFVVILGEDEIAKGTFILKDMQAGTQEECSLASVFEILKKKGHLSDA